MPFDEPSAFGLTISGNFMLRRQPLARRSPSPGTPASGCRAAAARACRAPCRARSTASPSRSRCTGCRAARTAPGTCASRLRPSTPSAMLNTRSTSASASTRGSSAWPRAARRSWPVALERVADRVDRLGRVVLGLGVVAAFESTRLTLKVKPTRSGSARLRRAARRAGSPSQARAQRRRVRRSRAMRRVVGQAPRARPPRTATRPAPATAAR